MPASIRRITLAFFAVLAILLVPAAQAGAQGNAGIDQYTETPPAADGEGDAAAFGEAGGGGSSGAGGEDGGQPLPSDSRDDLESLGSDGVATADIAEATGPDSGSGGSSGSGRDDAGFEASQPAGAADSGGGSGDGVGGVIDALGGSGSDGLGIAFPLILVLSLLGVAGFLVARGRVGDPRG